jgi:hypothetical protein
LGSYIDRQVLECVVVHLLGKSELPHVVDALRAASGFAGGLNCRQQQGDQDANDRDDDEQFDERKTGATAPRKNTSQLLSPVTELMAQRMKPKCASARRFPLDLSSVVY